MRPADSPSERRSVRLGLLAIAVFSLVSPTFGAGAQEGRSAVILLYHHVSDATPPSTSVSPRTFDQHLDYLEREGYAVVPLADVARALADATPLPPKAVALTFDDAYSSIYSQALPRLERRGWSFTVFVATDPVDDGYAGYMSWNQLRDLESRGGSVANHSSDHGHLIRREPDESAVEWRARVRANITAAQARLAAELSRPLTLFAYPYGEFDAPLEAVVTELGLTAFGQQSGPTGATSSLRALPRYPLATDFDGVDALAEKLRTRSLPVTVLTPASRVLPANAPAPLLELRVADGPFRRDGLRCYVAGQEPAIIEWRGDVAAIQSRAPLGAGRSKYNCTAPSTSTSGVFYWYSHLWIQPRDDGSWYPD
jgi:peptidoglycan/xylan/chitin deacetylase (PgdA/CDA1 family)